MVHGADTRNRVAFQARGICVYSKIAGVKIYAYGICWRSREIEKIEKNVKETAEKTKYRSKLLLGYK